MKMRPKRMCPIDEGEVKRMLQYVRFKQKIRTLPGPIRGPLLWLFSLVPYYRRARLPS